MKRTNKLSFKKETIRTLSPAEMNHAAGGAGALADGGAVVAKSEFCNVGGGGAATSGSITSMSVIIGVGGGVIEKHRADLAASGSAR